MNSKNMMLIFDVIVLVLGVYILYQARFMKVNQEVPSLFVSAQETRHCRNRKGFINFLYSKANIFGVVDIVYGLEGLYDDGFTAWNESLPKVNTAVNIIVLLGFLSVWIWFSVQLRKGKNEFF